MLHRLMSTFRINQNTSLEFVHLQVTDLKRALDFYATGLGLKYAMEKDDTVALKSQANAHRIILTENPRVKSRPGSTVGLYHVAFLFASRSDLASVYRNMLNMGYQFDGFADHGVSESLYLADPDGIGIELYAEKPREQWPYQDGQLQMGTWDLDIQSLMELATLRKQDADIKIGHIHLNVSNLEKTEYFYTSVLGLHVIQRSISKALFFAANNYHHHIGANIWQGAGIPPAPENSIGIKKFALQVSQSEALHELKTHLTELHYPFLTDGQDVIIRDPDGIEIKIICVAQNTVKEKKQNPKKFLSFERKNNILIQVPK